MDLCARRGEGIRMKSSVATALTACSRAVRGASGASLNTRPALTITACWLSFDRERTDEILSGVWPGASQRPPDRGSDRTIP
jgi:hypothetical protein